MNSKIKLFALSCLVTLTFSGASNGQTIDGVSANNFPIALKGYCPITSVDQQKLVSGDAKFRFVFGNEQFLFATQGALSKFESSENKEQLIPMLSGLCPTTTVKGGTPKFGSPAISLLFHKRLYWFSSEDAKAKFKNDSWKYEPAFGGYCTYCYIYKSKQPEEARYIKGTWFSHHYGSDGRLYLFPNSATVQNFLAEEDRPRFLGIDLVKVDVVDSSEKIDVEVFATHGRRTFFFKTEENRDKFVENPEPYLQTWRSSN